MEYFWPKGCCRCGLAIAISCLLAAAINLAVAQDPAFDSAARAVKHRPPRTVSQALGEIADFDFIEQSLKDVLEVLSDRLQVPHRVDWRRLGDAGVLQSTPITFQAKKISYRSALRLILRRVEVTVIENEDELAFTTPEAADTQFQHKVYDVADLIDAPDTASSRGKRASQRLKQLLQAWVAPLSWAEVGGPNSIQAGPGGRLVIAAPYDFQQELGVALAQLRQARRDFAEHPWRPREKMTLPDLPADPLEMALARPCAFDFDQTPLGDVASVLSDEADANILLDLPRLKEIGIDASTPVTTRVSGRSVRKALESIADQLELAIVLQHEVVELRPKDSGCEPSMPRLYLIDDLTGPFSAEERWLDPVERAERWQTLIVETIHPQSWNTVGGPNVAKFLHHPPTLFIDAETSTHLAVERLLAELRKTRPTREGNLPSAAELDAAYATRLVVRRFALLQQVAATPSPSGQAELPPQREFPEAEAVVRVIRKHVGEEATWGDPASYLDHVGSTILMRARPALVEKVAELLEQQHWLQPVR